MNKKIYSLKDTEVIVERLIENYTSQREFDKELKSHINKIKVSGISERLLNSHFKVIERTIGGKLSSFEKENESSNKSKKHPISKKLLTKANNYRLNHIMSLVRERRIDNDLDCVMKQIEENTKDFFDFVFSRKKLYQFLTENKPVIKLLNGVFKNIRKNEILDRISRHEIPLNMIQYFITYHKRVQERNRMYMYYYGYAVFFLERGMYEKSLMYLAKMKSDNFIFKYDIYNFKLRAYYEHENSQKTLNLLDSYKQFLRKDRFFSEDRKIPHRNFAKYLTYIIKLSEGMKNYDLAEISDSLKEENVASKEWLQQKVNSLEKRRIQKYIMK